MKEHSKALKVQCPWHGSKIDVRSGEPTKPPARQAVSSYEVKIQDNNILVRKKIKQLSLCDCLFI